MASFRILVPGSNKRSFHYVSIFIFVLNLLVFGRIFLEMEGRNKWLSLAGTVLCVSGILFSIIKINHRPGTIHAVHFVLVTLIWMFLPAWVPAISVAVFAGMTIIAAREKWIRFSDAGVHFPSFPPRIIPWREVQTVILKNAVLTIEMSGNRFFQIVVPAYGFEGDEVQFNEQCKHWIETSKHADKR
jgi:hypothetical protein